MKQKTRRKIVGILVSVLLSVLAVDAVLRYIDPLGVYRYYVDGSRLIAAYVDSERGYAMYPGLYEFMQFQAVILPDETRRVPDTKASDCTIAFLGDSVTFGFPVDDDETFVNLIASQIEAHVVNTAASGYNSRNILRTLQSYPATGYVYVAVNNDDVGAYSTTKQFPTPFQYDHTAIETYLNAAFQTDNVPEPERFARDIAAIRAHENVLIVTFEDARGWYRQLVTLAPETVVLPRYTGRVSWFDGHPDAKTHAEIAASMLDEVRALEARACRTK